VTLRWQSGLGFYLREKGMLLGIEIPAGAVVAVP
jgi:hypothetical protein